MTFKVEIYHWFVKRWIHSISCGCSNKQLVKTNLHKLSSNLSGHKMGRNCFILYGSSNPVHLGLILVGATEIHTCGFKGFQMLIPHFWQYFIPKPKVSTENWYWYWRGKGGLLRIIFTLNNDNNNKKNTYSAPVSTTSDAHRKKETQILMKSSCGFWGPLWTHE